jgi:predicted short-subunit dehydrogenase-like oxidoreductase (DUF2520 family)
MKAWGDLAGTDDALVDEPQPRREPDGGPGRPDSRALEDLRRRGIDLDPARHGAPGTHRHGDLEHASDHQHPHARSEPGEPPIIGIVGAGAVGTALGVALSRAGWPVAAVASRDEGRRERFRSLVPGARTFAEATALLDEVELIVLAVPDDAIGALAGDLRMYSGQAMIHTSGALGAEVLEPARAAGTQVGAFHPLVAFADTERAVAALHGATIAVEGDDQLASLLAELAEAIGATAVRLAPGSKAAYHAAAMLSAGGFVALLDAIAELGRVAGLDEAGSLAIYGGLVEQTLGNARALGIGRALTGPMVRGDVGTIRRHVAALERSAPGVLALYRAVAEREVAIAEARGALAPEVAADIRHAVARPDRGATIPSDGA